MASPFGDIEFNDGDEMPTLQPGSKEYVIQMTTDYKAYVRGFPMKVERGDRVDDIMEDDVYDFFASRGICAIDNINLIPARGAQSMSSVVTFSNAEGLSEALKLKDQKFQGCAIEVRIDRPRDGNRSRPPLRSTGGFGESRSEMPPKPAYQPGSLSRNNFGQQTTVAPRREVSQYQPGTYTQPYREKQQQERSAQRYEPSSRIPQKGTFAGFRDADRKPTFEEIRPPKEEWKTGSGSGNRFEDSKRPCGQLRINNTYDSLKK